MLEDKEYIICSAFKTIILPYIHREPTFEELTNNKILKPDNYDKYMVIFTGPRHSDIFQYMYELNIVYEYKSSTQGFMTNEYRFVDRQEAFKIALAAGQIKTEIKENDIKNGRQLYSEDLW